METQLKEYEFTNCSEVQAVEMRECLLKVAKRLGKLLVWDYGGGVKDETYFSFTFKGKRVDSFRFRLDEETIPGTVVACCLEEGWVTYLETGGKDYELELKRMAYSGWLEILDERCKPILRVTMKKTVTKRDRCFLCGFTSDIIACTIGVRTLDSAEPSQLFPDLKRINTCCERCLMSYPEFFQPKEM